MTDTHLVAYNCKHSVIYYILISAGEGYNLENPTNPNNEDVVLSVQSGLGMIKRQFN